MTLKLALAACLVLGAYAQTPQTSQTPAPSAPQASPAPPQVSAEAMTQAIYTSLLRRMEVNEQLSDRVEAKNGDPRHLTRKWLQLQTGLTDEEFAKVRKILLDGIAVNNAKRAEAKDAFDKARKDNGAGPTGPFTLTAEQKKTIGALHTQREQLVLDHVKQIEAALGPERFQQFDTALRKSIGSSVKVFPVRKK